MNIKTKEGNKQYKAGSSFEYRLMRKLAHKGLCVRSAGSHGVVDIILLSKDFTDLIQCKYTEKDNADLTALLKGDNIKLFEKLEVSNNTRKFLVIKQGRANDPLILRYEPLWEKWIGAFLY